MFTVEGAILRQARPHVGYIRPECVQMRPTAGPVLPDYVLMVKFGGGAETLTHNTL